MYIMSCAYRACDRLRCTDCDFSVSSFDNVQWASNIDYLFLRNNMPDYERLKSKLRAKKGMFFFKLYFLKKSLFRSSTYNDSEQISHKSGQTLPYVSDQIIGRLLHILFKIAPLQQKGSTSLVITSEPHQTRGMHNVFKLHYLQTFNLCELLDTGKDIVGPIPSISVR